MRDLIVVLAEAKFSVSLVNTHVVAEQKEAAKKETTKH